MTAEPRYVYPSPSMFGPVWCELPACSAEHVVIPKTDYEALVNAAAAVHELVADIPNLDALSPSDVAAFIRGRWTTSELHRVREECARLREQCSAWMNGVADAVEPLGYDRDAACGPADLLPGLLTLAERAGSGAHAPDLPEPEPETAGSITYRSTGRGAYDVMQSRAEGPDQVLAMVQFTEGVRGRVHALERFIASLRETSQDGTR